jgi:hypothetical protein
MSWACASRPQRAPGRSRRRPRPAPLARVPRARLRAHPLYALVPPFAGNGPLINLLGLSSSLAIVVGVRLHRPSLSRFPIDTLKMDRSFIAAGEADASLAAAIVALGESLNLEVVAEGIELPEQIRALRRLGCGLRQGFPSRTRWDRDALRAYLRRSADGALRDAA